MKIYGYLAFASLLLLGICVFNTQYLDRTGNEFQHQLEGIATAIQQNQWQEADKQMLATHQQWDHTKKGWSCIIDHKEIHDIEISIARLQSYINYQQEMESSNEIFVLQALISHIHGLESVNLGNVL